MSIEGESQQSPQGVFYQKLWDVLREGIIEGIIDSKKGTDFTLIQHKLDADLFKKDNTFPPTIDPHKVAEAGNYLLTLGIPDPIDIGAVEDMLLSPEERKAKDMLASIEIESAIESLRNKEE